MLSGDFRKSGLEQQLDPQSTGSLPPVIDPLNPVTSVLIPTMIKLALGALKADQLRADGETLYAAVQPLLALMVIFGMVPKQVRINPPGGAAGIKLVLGEDISPYVYPADLVAALNDQDLPFDLPGVGTGTGLEVQYEAPELPYYAPRLLRRWQKRVEVDGSGLASTAKNIDDQNIQALSWDLSSVPGADLGALCSELIAETPSMGPLRLFVEEALSEFKTEAESRAETHLYSIGFSGLIYDPDTWQHLFRWHESPSRRRVRIDTVRTIGLLVWRGITGPDVDGSPTDTGNSVDGPGKLDTFLREEIFGREVQTDTGTVRAYVPILERIETGLEQAKVEGDLITEASLSSWNTRGGKARGILGKLARVMARDHKKIIEFSDDMADKPAPPKAAEIRGMSTLGFIGLMIRSNFIRYESDTLVQPPGTSMDGLEARSPQIIPLQILVQQFPIYWELEQGTARTRARETLMLIERDLLIIYGVLLRVSGAEHTITAPELRAQMELWRGPPPFLSYYAVPISDEEAEVMGFPSSGDGEDSPPIQRYKDLADLCTVRMTLNQAGPVTEGATMIRKAAGYARQMYMRTTEPSEDDIYETWLALGMAVVSADRFFEAGRDTKNVAVLIQRFLEGFAEGAGIGATEAELQGLLPPGESAETTADKMTELFTNNLEALPLQVAFPQFFMAGMVFGMGEYVTETATSIFNVLAEPYEFLNSVFDALEFLMETPTGDLFFEMGKAMGVEAIKEVDRLNSYTNPIAFLFQVGRFIGPFVLEELISMLFEGYVVGPLLNEAQKAVRRALKMPGTGYLDELALGAKMAPDFEAFSSDLPNMRVNLRAAASMELEEFVDDVLGDAFFNEAPENVTSLPSISAYDTNPGLAEVDWLRTLYEQWRRRLDYLMREDLLDQASDAFPHLFTTGD